MPGLKSKYNWQILEAAKMNYRRGDRVEGLFSSIGRVGIVQKVVGSRCKRYIFGDDRNILVLWYDDFWAHNRTRRLDLDVPSLIKPRKRPNSHLMT